MICSVTNTTKTRLGIAWDQILPRLTSIIVTSWVVRISFSCWEEGTVKIVHESFIVNKLKPTNCWLLCKKPYAHPMLVFMSCGLGVIFFLNCVIALQDCKKGEKNIWGNDKMTQLVGGFRLGLYLNHSKDWVQCSENCFAVIICVNGSIPIHVTCMRSIEVHNLG